MLNYFTDNRGFMTSNGEPDQSRSARYVCKDYVSGKLLHAVSPPTIAQELYHTFPEKTRKDISEESLPKRQLRAMRVSLIYHYLFKRMVHKMLFFK